MKSFLVNVLSATIIFFAVSLMFSSLKAEKPANDISEKETKVIAGEKKGEGGKESATQATDILKSEHSIIVPVVVAIAREADTIEKTGKVDADRVTKMVDFTLNFVGKYHHAKEDCLFVKMRKHNQGDVADVLVLDHDEEPPIIKAISDSLPAAAKGDKDAIKTVEDNLRKYAKLLGGHAKKENEAAFPMADRVLTEEEQKQLFDAVKKLEDDEKNKGIYDKYRTLAKELIKVE